MGRKSVILACVFFSVVLGDAGGSIFDLTPDPNPVLQDNNGVGFDASLAANKHVGIGEESPQPSVIRFQTTIPTTPAPRVVYVQQPNYNHPPLPPLPNHPPPRRPCKRDLAGNNPTDAAADAQNQQHDPSLSTDHDIDDDDKDRRGTNQIDQVAEDFKKFLIDNKVNLTKQDEDLLGQFKEHQKAKLLAQQKQARSAPEHAANATAESDADRQARSLPDPAIQHLPILNQTGAPDRIVRVPEMMGHPMSVGGGMMNQPMGQPMMGGGMMGQPMGQQMMGGGMMNQPMMGQQGSGMMSDGGMNRGMRSVPQDLAQNATHEQHARSVPEQPANATHEQHVRNAPDQIVNATHEQHARSAPEHAANATTVPEVDRHFRSIPAAAPIIQQQFIPGQAPVLNQSEVPDRFIRVPQMMGQPMMGGGGMMNQPMGHNMMGGGMMNQPMMGQQGPGMMSGGGMNMGGHPRSVSVDQAPNATHDLHARSIPEQPANATHELHARSVPEQLANATHEQHARSVPEQPANATHEQHVRGAPEQPANATHEQHARSVPEQPANATHEQHVRSAPEHVVNATADTEADRNARNIPSPAATPEQAADDHKANLTKRAISPRFGGSMAQKVMNYFS